MSIQLVLVSVSDYMATSALLNMGDEPRPRNASQKGVNNCWLCGEDNVNSGFWWRRVNMSRRLLGCVKRKCGGGVESKIKLHFQSFLLRKSGGKAKSRE